MQDMTNVLTDDNGNCSSKYNPYGDMDRLMEAMIRKCTQQHDATIATMKNDKNYTSNNTTPGE